MMARSHRVGINTGVNCLLLTESLRLGELHGRLLTWQRNVISTGKHSLRVLLTFILELKTVLVTIEGQIFRFPVKSQFMFDINILTELIVHNNRDKSPIDYFRW